MMNKNFSIRVGEKMEELELKCLTPKDKENLLIDMYNTILAHFNSDNLHE